LPGGQKKKKKVSEGEKDTSPTDRRRDTHQQLVCILAKEGDKHKETGTHGRRKSSTVIHRFSFLNDDHHSEEVKSEEEKHTSKEQNS
jgi:hypothetical protein